MPGAGEATLLRALFEGVGFSKTAHRPRTFFYDTAAAASVKVRVSSHIATQLRHAPLFSGVTIKYEVDVAIFQNPPRLSRNTAVARTLCG